jgi:hypothetical protein
MELPAEILAIILGRVYYYHKDRRLHTPDHPTLAACSLVHPSWTALSQELLFCHITFRESLRFFRDHATANQSDRSRELCAYVKIVDIHFKHPNQGLWSASQPAGTFSAIGLYPRELSELLRRCPHVYELGLETSLVFSLGIDDLEAIKLEGAHVRSLCLSGGSVQSPILFELLGSLPGIQFLRVEVEVAAEPPPTQLEGVHLYELILVRGLPVATIKWLLSSSKSSLRILELRDIPGSDTKTLIRDDYAANLHSLRLLHADRLTVSSLLPACTQLKQFVCLNVPKMTKLELFLPASVETLTMISISSQPYIGSILKTVKSHLELKILELDQSITLNNSNFTAVTEMCEEMGTRLKADQPSFWLVSLRCITRIRRL